MLRKTGELLLIIGLLLSIAFDATMLWMNQLDVIMSSPKTVAVVAYASIALVQCVIVYLILRKR